MKKIIIIIVLLGLSGCINAQIGYKYTKWVKKHKYLGEAKHSGIWYTYSNYFIHETNEKAFTGATYIVSTIDGKIVEIFYSFPRNYCDAVRNYCEKSGYIFYDNILGFVYKSIGDRIRYSYTEPKSDDESLMLRISALTLNVRLISGWENDNE